MPEEEPIADFGNQEYSPTDVDDDIDNKETEIDPEQEEREPSAPEVERLPANESADAPEPEKIIDPELQAVIERVDKDVEGWQKVGGGQNEWVTDGTRIFNLDTGKTYTDIAHPEALSRMQDATRQWNEGGSDHYIESVGIYEKGEANVISVVQIIRGEQRADGLWNVSWAWHEKEVDKQKEKEEEPEPNAASELRTESGVVPWSERVDAVAANDDPESSPEMVMVVEYAQDSSVEDSQMFETSIEPVEIPAEVLTNETVVTMIAANIEAALSESQPEIAVLEERNDDAETFTATDSLVAELLRVDPLVDEVAPVAAHVDIARPNMYSEPAPDTHRGAVDKTNETSASKSVSVAPAELIMELKPERPNVSIAFANDNKQPSVSAERLLEADTIAVVEFVGDQRTVEVGLQAIVSHEIATKNAPEPAKIVLGEQLAKDIRTVVAPEKHIDMKSVDLKNETPTIADDRQDTHQPSVQEELISAILNIDALESVEVLDGATVASNDSQESITVMDTHVGAIDTRGISIVAAPTELRPERPEMSRAFVNDNKPPFVLAERLPEAAKPAIDMMQGTMEHMRSEENRRGLLSKESSALLSRNEQRTHLKGAEMLAHVPGIATPGSQVVPFSEIARSTGTQRTPWTSLPSIEPEGARARRQVSNLNGVIMEMAA